MNRETTRTSLDPLEDQEVFDSDSEESSDSDDVQPQSPVPEDLTTVLDNLTISPDRRFVGGFHPYYAPDAQAYYYGLDTTASWNASRYSTISSSSISMPVPCISSQPLTVQSAPPSYVSAEPSHSSHSDAHSASRRRTSSPPMSPILLSSKQSASRQSTPVMKHTRPPRPRLSEPIKYERSPSPASSFAYHPGRAQCGGTTKLGNQCKNTVKISSASSPSGSGRVYCYLHTVKVLKPTGFHSRKTGLLDTWVDFEDWIPAYLQPATQAALRDEMDKLPSRSDVEGYIYTYEIRDPTDKQNIKLKVGRTVNLVKRVDEWRCQCRSKEHVLRGFYPNTVEVDEDENDGSLRQGRVKGGAKGPWCHRLERLVHLELIDLACNRTYLLPEWPQLDAPPAPADAARSKRAKECADCSTRHKEIFEFKRWTKGKYVGKEWEVLVERVIQRWGQFVELYV